MKTAITFIFFLFAFNLSAQVWVDQNASWHYDVWNLGLVGYDHYEYTQDITIGGKTCQQIKHTHYIQWGGSSAIDTFSLSTNFTYVSSDTVFYWRDNQYFTLFDFGASIGDQWLIGISDPNAGQFSCGDSSYVEVVDTGSMIINSVSYRTITLDTVANSPIGMRGLYVERFGLMNTSTPWQLFPSIRNCDPQIVVEWNVLSFSCFEDDSFSLYTPSGQPCDPFSVGLHEEPELVLNVSPNPVIDLVTVEVNNTDIEGSEYEIRNVNGKLVAKNYLNSAGNINLTKFSAGVYFLSITLSNKTYTRKIIKE